jgi:hypothetical protein
MQTFRNIMEMGAVPEDLWQYMLTLRTDEADFMDYLGGDVYLLETLDDLAQVPVWDLERDGITLASSAGGFDIAEELPGGEHAVFVSITSNAGGATYFIPKQLWTDNVLESIQLTN